MSKIKKNIYIFFGPPGSGKGTQADMLGKKLNLPTLSTGELFRREVEAGTELGKTAKAIMDKGDLVSDKLVNAMVEKRCEDDDTKQGIIFDGYPRNKKQLEFIISLLDKIVEKDDTIRAILVNVSDEEVIKRIGGRRVCDCGSAYHILYNSPQKKEICDKCGGKLYIRDDDTPEVMKGRLSIYHKNTSFLLDYFRKNNQLIQIDGEQTIDKVQEDIIKEIKNSV